MEDTDYSVAGSPLKTWIRGEEIISPHYDVISILCRRLTVQWPCQSPWIWFTFENIEWVRTNAFMNQDWSCQDRHNEGTDQNLICTRCYPSNDTLQIRGTSTWTYLPATLPLCVPSQTLIVAQTAPNSKSFQRCSRSNINCIHSFQKVKFIAGCSYILYIHMCWFWTASANIYK